MSKIHIDEKKSIFIHLDGARREFADPTLEKIDVNAWHPSNILAKRIWRCFEALKDIENLLKGTSALSSNERRRRIKTIVTHLYSLCRAIQDLCNYLTSDSEMSNQLDKAQRANLIKLRESFLKLVPTDKTSPIKGIRDKLSAHVEELMPYEAKHIFDKAENHDVGTWLHGCLITLSLLLRLDVFAWTTGDCSEGYFRIMNVEPWLVTLKLEDGQPKELVGVDLAVSPKTLVLEVCNEVIKASQWMFREGKLGIVLHENVITNSEESAYDWTLEDVAPWKPFLSSISDFYKPKT